jgi:hypothetical protein
MSVINSVTNMPVIRPVACLDKLEIIDIAKKIDTYNISILPYEDCCTVFVPKHPVIKPNLNEIALEEEASLVEKQLIEVIDTDFSKGTYQVKISVVPKEYSDATKVSVFFGVQEIPLILNRYAYEGTAELSLTNNYDSNVAFLIVNGDKRNTEVLKNYEGLQTKLEDLLYGSIPEIPEYKDGKLYFDDEIEFTLNAYEDYGYETLELVLAVNEEERTVVNLLESMEEKGEEKNNSIEDVFSGLFGSSVETVEPNAHETESTEQPEEDAFTKPQMVYGLSGTTMLKEVLEVADGQKIRLFLRAKCENGYRLEYDLFSGVVEAEGPNGFVETMDYFVPNYCIYDKNGNKLKIR